MELIYLMKRLNSFPSSNYLISVWVHLWNFHFILQYSLVECYEQEKKANVEFPITMQVKNQIIVEWQNIFVFVFF